MENEPDFAFGLWLTLDASSERHLASVIASLATRFGGPVFTPHITLRARLPTEEAARELAARACAGVAPIEVELTRIDVGRAPYEALTLRPSSADALLELAARAGVEVSSYAPHLSLYYGDCDARSLCAALEPMLALPMRVRVRAVEVWSLRGQVATWARRDVLVLTPRASA